MIKMHSELDSLPEEIKRNSVVLHFIYFCQVKSRSSSVKEMNIPDPSSFGSVAEFAFFDKVYLDVVFSFKIHSLRTTM